MGRDYVSELRPPTGLLFIPQMIYRASLNDVPDLKHMPLTFNEVQMHKTGIDG
jgi:hypothetical protein